MDVIKLGVWRALICHWCLRRSYRPSLPEEFCQIGSCHPNVDLHFAKEAVLFVVFRYRRRAAQRYYVLGSIMDLSLLLRAASMRTLLTVSIEKFIGSLMLKLNGTWPV